MKMRRLLAVILPVAAGALIAVVVAGCGGSSSGTAGGGSAYGNAAAHAQARDRHRQHPGDQARPDPRGRPWTHPVSLREGQRRHQQLQRGVRQHLASVDGGKAKVGTRVTAAKLASTKRSDGKTAITYAGHPLYTYAGDQKPGDVAGQGLDQFGAEWYVVAPDGNKIDNG